MADEDAAADQGGVKTVDVEPDVDQKTAAALNAADVGVVTKPPEDDSNEIKNLKAQIDRLKQDTERERGARVQLEQRSQQSETQAVDNQMQAFKNLQAAKIAEIANVKNALRAARAEGDIDKEAELIETLSGLAVQRTQIDQAIDYETQQRQVRQQQPQRQQPSESERFLAALNPRAREWVTQNNALPGTERHAKAMQAHHHALGEGLQEGSDEYYSHLDRYLAGGDRQQPPNRQQQRQPAYAMPATPRQPSGSAPRVNGRSLQLGPKTRQTAAELDMTDQEYAKFAIEEIDAGRANPNDYLN